MIRADGEGDPAMLTADKIAICHWSNGGYWNMIEVSESALAGHDNHQFDIWPPVEGVTDGQNWGRGEAVYLNGCDVTTHPMPTASPSPSPSVTSSPSTEPTVSLSPSPEPTVTVTATAEPIPPTPCPTVTADAAVMIPMVAAVLASMAWGFRRRR